MAAFITPDGLACKPRAVRRRAVHYSVPVGLQSVNQPEAPRPPRPPLWQTLRAAPATTAIFAVCAIVYLMARAVGDPTTNATLIQFGAVGRRLVWPGEYWRLGTSMFMHIGVIHLICNTYFGFRLCALAEGQIGVPRFLVLYLASGIVGSAVSVIGHDALSAGASGALFGVVGWMLVTLRMRAGSMRAFTQNPMIRQQLIWIGAWFVLGAFAGFDNYAHGGGMLFGGLYGWALAAEPGKKRRWRVAAAFWVAGLLVFASLRPLPWVHQILPSEELVAGERSAGD
jgi:rhomboid protease GluP